MATYNITFNDDSNSNDYGVDFTNKREAIAKATEILRHRSSYTDDYIGGTISVYCVEKQEDVWMRDIK